MTRQRKLLGKGTEMGRCLACSRNSKEVSVARAEGTKTSVVAESEKRQLWGKH